MLILRWTVFLPFLAITTLLGCAGHVTEYGYLDEVSTRGSQDIYVHEDTRNKLTRGKELDRVWVNPDFNIGRYRKIYIKPVEINPDLMSEEQGSQFADYFTKSLQDENTDETLFLFADNRSGSRVLSDDAETWQKDIADIAKDLVLEIAAVKV